MRENRTYGSEGGEAKSLPYPYRRRAPQDLAQRPCPSPRSRSHCRRTVHISLQLCAQKCALEKSLMRTPIFITQYQYINKYVHNRRDACMRS